MTEFDPRPAFPCQGIPDIAPQARLLGLYPQIQEGLWMQRLKVFGGALSPSQWRALAELVRRLTPGTPLHLTTRQDVEFHDLTPEQVAPLQQGLCAAGLTGVGSCGDTLRNITVCPCAGLAAGSADLAGLAEQIRRLLEDAEGVYALPRKLKITLACGDTCGQPFINDLAFVARRRDGQWGFRVVGAGALGARPATGIELADWIAPSDVLPWSLAMLRLFAAEGDRTNRGKARVRHVRERIGDQAFLSRLGEELSAAKADRDWPGMTLSEASPALAGRHMLIFANGDITPDMADALAALAEGDGLAVRLVNQHRLEVFGPTDAAVRAAIAGQPALAEAARPQASVVTCPGRRWCARGLTDTNALADRIRAEAGASLRAGAHVCISGCPNGCVHSTVADLGLTGGQSDGKDAYVLYRGGDMGRTDRLAELVGRRLSADEVIKAIIAP
jgi:sulfite reductase beta subunit-like hemoprotein